MARSNDEILGKLQSTIGDWSDEVTDAHERLTTQIRETKGQLTTLVKILASKQANGIALEEALQKISTLKSLVDEKETSLRSALVEKSALETQESEQAKTLEEARGETQALQGLVAKKQEDLALSTDAIDRLKDTVAALEAGRDTLKAQLQSALDTEKSLVEDLDGSKHELDARGAELIAQSEELVRVKDLLDQSSTSEAQHKNELTQLRDELAKLEDRIQNAQEEAAVSEAAYTKTRLDLDAASARAIELTRSKEEVLQKKETLRESHEKLDRAFEHAQDDLERLRNERTAGTDRANALSNEIDALQAELAETSKELQHADEEITLLRERAEGKGTALEQAMSKVDGLLKQAEDRSELERSSRQQLEDMNELLGERTSALTATEKTLEALRKEVAASNEELAVRASRFLALEEELAEASARHDDSKAAAETLVEKLVAKKTSLSAELEKFKTAAEAKLTLLTEEFHTVNDAKDDLTRQLKRFEGEANEMRECLDAEEKRKRQVQEEIDTLRRSREDLEIQVESLRSENDSVRTDLVEHKAKTVELETLKALLTEREAAVHKATQQIEEAEGHDETQGKALADALAEIDKRKAEARIYEVEVCKMKNTLTDREDALKESTEEFETRLESSTSRIREADLQLEDAREELEVWKDVVAERDAQLDSLRAHLEQAGNGADEAERISFAAYDAQGRKRTMGEILVNAGIVTERQLESALDEQRSSHQRRLGTILIEKGMVREEILSQVLASQLRLPFVNLETLAIDPKISQLISGETATHHMCLPIERLGNRLKVAMANPLDVIAIEDLEIATGFSIQPVVASLSEITSAIVRSYGAQRTSTAPAPLAEADTAPRGRTF